MLYFIKAGSRLTGLPSRLWQATQAQPPSPALAVSLPLPVAQLAFAVAATARQQPLKLHND